MSRTRRFLPSMSLLAAFEAVLRTGSTSGAARELSLSQSTVSRLIQNLEGQLGRELFERQRQKLVPTAAAQAYGHDVTRALDLIQHGSIKLAVNPGGGALSLAILPAFGARWLAPRLRDFLTSHPGVSVSLTTRLRRFDFTAEGVDAAVHYGSAPWPDLQFVKIFDERLTACAAPLLLSPQPPESVTDVLNLPLFQFESRPTAWADWFANRGVDAPAVHGMMFDQFATLTQAAISGLGVALLPDYIATAEIEAGHLVPLFRRALAGDGAYWLVWPGSRAEYPPLRSFRNWLEREATASPAPAT